MVKNNFSKDVKIEKTIRLPNYLIEKIEKEAANQNISFSDYVNKAVEKVLSKLMED